jgi:alpha-N-arabinofuranosidase
VNQVLVGARAPGAIIDKNIYGHFSEHLGRCVYEGYWVGEDSPIPNVRGIRTDVVEALRAVQPPVLRWPGGCFADEYHWMDGTGPRQHRPAMVNTHWGKVVENNHFGTHEFFDLCEMLGADPYICGNVGSGTVREMQEWVEYITFDGTSPMADLRRANGREAPWRLPFFGVGNENWGCGGHMRAEYYADVYRRYATYVRNLGGNRVFKIACGPNVADYHWTEVLMREAGRMMDGLSLHYYTHVGRGEGLSNSATEFGEAEWFAVLRNALRMEELVARHAAIMDRFDPERRVALVVDEWGTWYRVEPGTNPGFLYQQNSLRDALVAGVHLDIFNNHCARVRMANIAQTVNVLQAMILTRDAELVRTPTYHVFEMYRVHQGATLLPAVVAGERYVRGDEAIPALSASASRAPDGRVHISLCNLHPTADMPVDVRLPGVRAGEASGRVLTGPSIQAHNTFEAPAVVAPAVLAGVRLHGDGLEVVLPARSVAVLEAQAEG